MVRKTSRRATGVEEEYVLCARAFSSPAAVSETICGRCRRTDLAPENPEFELMLQKTKCLTRDQNRNQCQACFTASLGCTFQLPLTASRTKRIKRGLGDDHRVEEGGLGLLASALPEESVGVRRTEQSARRAGMLRLSLSHSSALSASTRQKGRSHNERDVSGFSC